MNFIKIQNRMEDLRREIGGQKLLEVSKLGGCWRDEADPQVSRIFLLESHDERVEFVFRHYHHVRLSTTARLTASTQRREGKSAVFSIKNEWNKIKFLLQKYRRQLKVFAVTFLKVKKRVGCGSETVRFDAETTTERKVVAWRCRFFLSFVQGILKREVSLYHWPPVWLVWISLFCK